MGSTTVLGNDFFSLMLQFSVVGPPSDCSSPLVHVSFSQCQHFIFVICVVIAVIILLLASVGSGWGIPCERILHSAMIDCVRGAHMALSAI